MNTKLLWVMMLALILAGQPASADFTIPNVGDALHAAQSQVDAGDIAILAAGSAGTGVVTGCEVTAQGSPNMTLAVASGSILVLQTPASVTSGNVTITTADATYARFDLVVVASDGTKSVVAGTPAATPVYPTIPASSVVLASVYVPAGDTAIAANQIVDKRIIITNPTFAEADTLDTVFDRGKIIDGANSLANAVRIGDGTTPWCIYTDASAGPQIRPCTDANIKTTIPTNFTWALRDEEGAADVETIDPDAATQLGKYTYGTAYKPLKSVWFGAGSLSTDGTQCAAPAEVTINSGPKLWTIICTDNDASTIYGNVKMPDSWDGGTVTFEHVYIQTAADTSALNGDIAAQCRGNGEAPSSTWGTEVAIDDAAVTGSNQNDYTTSAAVTPAGTCAAGDMLYFRYQLDATGTTTAVATLHHLGFKMEYAITSRSD